MSQSLIQRNQSIYDSVTQSSDIFCGIVMIRDIKASFLANDVLDRKDKQEITSKAAFVSDFVTLFHSTEAPRIHCGSSPLQ